MQSLHFIPETNATYIKYLDAYVFLFANDFITNNVKLYGIWEPHLLFLFDRLLTAESVVLDIGAHIGLHSIYLSRKAHIVHSFEPHPDTVRLLQYNLLMNQIQNVHIHALGLGDRDEIREGMFLPGNVFDTACARFGSNVDMETKKWYPASIRVKPLDQWIKENPLHRLDLIKLDVEGFECAVIEGDLSAYSDHGKLFPR